MASRVVVVNGPRQVGKSWLMRRLAETTTGTYLSLDDTANLRSARLDPAGFVLREHGPLLIDEVQRGGDPLVLAIKAAVDRSDERGQYILAGSTRFLTEPRLSESLAGRARFVDLWPLSQGEIGRLTVGDRFLDAAVYGAEALADLGREAAPLSRAATFERVLRGGYPEAVLATSDRDRNEFFSDYLRTISQRDITELSRMADRIDLPSVLRLLASRTASELNMTDLSNDAGLGRDTVRRYLPLIDAIFLTHRLPAWSGNLTSRTKRRPKTHLTDTGLVGHLARVRVDDFARPGNAFAGPLLETFVINELTRQLAWTDHQVTLSHWHDANDREIDVIVESGAGNLVGIEVKAAIDVDDGDFRHLTYMRDRRPNFVAGVVLHCGDRVRRFGDRLFAMPVSTLWS
jgi:uncharacterized protein